MDTLLRTARRNGLSLDPESSTLDETGADFRVVKGADANGVQWIVRVPRRAGLMEEAAREYRILRALRTRLPVAVPDWRVFTGDLIAYPRLSGEPAAVVDVSAGGYVWRFDKDSPPDEFLRSLARALAALHGIGRETLVAAGVAVLEPEVLRDRWSRRMEAARAMLRVPPVVWRRWQGWVEEASFWPVATSFVHGDLHPAHILIDRGSVVCGLIDWSEAHVGDPATDFTLLLATLGRGFVSAALAEYARLGGPVWPRMLDHVGETWCAYPAVIAEYSARIGEPAHLELAQRLVDASAPSP